MGDHGGKKSEGAVAEKNKDAQQEKKTQETNQTSDNSSSSFVPYPNFSGDNDADQFYGADRLLKDIGTGSPVGSKTSVTEDEKKRKKDEKEVASQLIQSNIAGLESGATTSFGDDSQPPTVLESKVSSETQPEGFSKSTGQKLKKQADALLTGAKGGNPSDDMSSNTGSDTVSDTGSSVSSSAVGDNTDDDNSSLSMEREMGQSGEAQSDPNSNTQQNLQKEDLDKARLYCDGIASDLLEDKEKFVIFAMIESGESYADIMKEVLRFNSWIDGSDIHLSKCAEEIRDNIQNLVRLVAQSSVGESVVDSDVSNQNEIHGEHSAKVVKERVGRESKNYIQEYIRHFNQSYYNKMQDNKVQEDMTI